VWWGEKSVKTFSRMLSRCGAKGSERKKETIKGLWEKVLSVLGKWATKWFGKGA